MVGCYAVGVGSSLDSKISILFTHKLEIQYNFIVNPKKTHHNLEKYKTPNRVLNAVVCFGALT